jgi:hypothetical protein
VTASQSRTHAVRPSERESEIAGEETSAEMACCNLFLCQPNTTAASFSVPLSPRHLLFPSRSSPPHLRLHNQLLLPPILPATNRSQSITTTIPRSSYYTPLITSSDAPAKALRQLLDSPGIHQGPACFDALSAKLIERAGFRFCFTSGRSFLLSFYFIF